jgi:hypothetical protein
MDKTARKVTEWLIFVYLILFPFGQLLRWEATIGASIIPIYPTDLVVGLIFGFGLLKSLPKPPLFNHIKNFFYLAGFSLLLSAAIFKTTLIATGALYFLRLIAYSYLFLAVWNIAKDKKKWFGLLLGVCFAIGVFGWFQYFFYSDLRALYAWGWDDHLFRLVGTFLDPTFTGIIIAFGFILSVSSFLFKKQKRFLFLSLFFLISAAFTYARAVYLGLFAGSLVVFILKKNLKLAAISVIAFFSLVLALPRPLGEGVRLERSYSVYSRLINYKETMAIIGKSPLFGIGYNNLCLARQKYLGDFNPVSHSCSGSDSSILLVLATTGVVGFLGFLKLIKEIIKGVSRDIYGVTFMGVGAALLLHGMFANSYFYSWIMGFMVILLAISLKEKTSE